jgi:hypothetical protein
MSGVHVWPRHRQMSLQYSLHRHSEINIPLIPRENRGFISVLNVRFVVANFVVRLNKYAKSPLSILDCHTTYTVKTDMLVVNEMLSETPVFLPPSFSLLPSFPPSGSSGSAGSPSLPPVRPPIGPDPDRPGLFYRSWPAVVSGYSGSARSAKSERGREVPNR